MRDFGGGEALVGEAGKFDQAAVGGEEVGVGAGGEWRVAGGGGGEGGGIGEGGGVGEVLELGERARGSGDVEFLRAEEGGFESVGFAAGEGDEGLEGGELAVELALQFTGRIVHLDLPAKQLGRSVVEGRRMRAEG